jgi:NADH-quinone oxidoreductase subunit N
LKSVEPGHTKTGLMSVADRPLADEPAAVAIAPTQPDRAALVRALEPAREYMAKLIALIAVITCTFGNLAAYGQTNIKRLMAYSTIAHAGYMMMAVPALLAMAGHNPELAQRAVAALCIYIGIYLFMNLSAFAIIAFLRNAMQSEQIADYAGLLRRAPRIAIYFSLILFSLIGLPPLAGFIGKFAIFAALVDGYRVTREAGHPAYYLMILLVAGGLNTAISLFYYLRIVKTMTMDPEPADRPPFRLTNPWATEAYLLAVVLPTVVLFIRWDELSEAALTAARHLLS